MEIEQVQRWVMSALLLTVAFVFAGGVAVLSATSDNAGARPGLLGISTFIGVIGVAGVRVVNERSFITAWLLLGTLPALLGWALTR